MSPHSRAMLQLARTPRWVAAFVLLVVATVVRRRWPSFVALLPAAVAGAVPGLNLSDVNGLVDGTGVFEIGWGIVLSTVTGTLLNRLSGRRLKQNTVSRRRINAVFGAMRAIRRFKIRFPLTYMSARR